MKIEQQEDTCKGLEGKWKWLEQFAADALNLKSEGMASKRQREVDSSVNIVNFPS